MKKHTRNLSWLSGVLFITLSACSTSTPVVNAPPPSATPIPTTAAVATISPVPTRRLQPTATEPPAVPTPTLEEYPHNERALVTIPTIVISAAAGDARIPVVQQAVDKWNQQFQQLGTPFHLGAVAQTIDLLPETDYQPLTGAGLAKIAKLPGDILIVLSPDPKFISFTHPYGNRRLIAIQGNPGGKDSLVIDQNVIAHELGHAIGLGHNNRPGALMCGGPTTAADCGSFVGTWPMDGSMAPLTDEEIAYLQQLYPPTWKPAP